jgi:cold shock CspA family protein
VRLSGILRSWNDERGFGFIAPTHGGAELFVHISALPRDGSRPVAGDSVTYELGRGKNGKPQAAAGLQGDEQGDKRLHDGPDKAIHIGAGSGTLFRVAAADDRRRR